MPVNSLIHLSDAALIAVHALDRLAQSDGKHLPARDLAVTIGASEHHLAKVMQRLGRAGFVKSVKGPSGGFVLNRPADTISFKDTIEAVDGPLSGDFCPYRSQACDPENCVFGVEVKNQARTLLEHLQNRTIADIGKRADVRP